MKPPLRRRYAVAFLTSLLLFISLPLPGCDEKEAASTNSAWVGQFQQLQSSQTQLAERNSSLSLTVGVLSALILVAIFIGAGWGSTTRKEKTLRNTTKDRNDP